ncbi:MAG: hypothetical protein SGJ27_24170 [Candidatus Melainabacteria bacterium]|nr:hypothetical protein [Candidatus Melainabacteria bacterium]
MTVLETSYAENANQLGVLRNLRNLIIAVFLTIILGWTFGNQALAKTFELGVEHTEVLPSVSAELRPGAKFNLSAVEAEGQSNVWVKLPEWMCGTWKVGRETAVFRQDFKTGKIDKEPFTYFARHDFQYGMQKDREGGIWHYVGTPYHSKTSLSQFNEIHLVKSKEFRIADEQGVSFTTVMTVIRSNSVSQILETFQQESITSYTPAATPGSIEMTASTKSFDANGKPSRQSNNIATIKQASPFSEVDTYQGKDMKALFCEFLISTDQTNLLPDQAPVP